jgi:hypothetical protein
MKPSYICAIDGIILSAGFSKCLEYEVHEYKPIAIINKNEDRIFAVIGLIFA